MRPRVEVTTRLAGFIKVEALQPNKETGELESIWEWESENLITNEGLARLRNVKLMNCMKYAIMGVRTGAAAGDDHALALTAEDGQAYYRPTVPPDIFNWCMEPATPDQTVRTLRAVSDTANPTNEESVLVADTYWKRTFVRQITYTHGCFPYSVEHRDALLLTDVGTLRQYPLMMEEAAFLQEISFVEYADIFRVEPIICAPSDPVPNKEFYDFNCSTIWNRVVLPQSLGFFGNGPPFDPSPADIVLANEGIIRITYELRVYPPVVPVVTVMDINGVSTTITTRAYELDDQSRWGTTGSSGGFITDFGGWAVGTSVDSPSRVGDVNVMPALSASVGGSNQDVPNRDILEEGDDYKILRYKVGTGEGNFAGGIGNLQTGRHANINNSFPMQTLIHTFNPKVQKTTLERFYFDVRYTWGVHV